MSEAQLQQAVIEMAHAFGWLVHHSRTARVQRKDGTIYYATALQGDPGFPDLVLARHGKFRFVELKSNRGRLSPQQLEWESHLEGKLWVWRPQDWRDGTIEGELR